MYIKDIEDACRKVLQGDKEALKQLGLDNATYPVRKRQNMSTTSLQVRYNGVLNTAVAARELQLSFLEKQCQLTLEYIKTIAAAKNVTIEHAVDPEDVTEIMLALIDEEANKYRHKNDADNISESEEEKAEETAEIREREAESLEEETEREEGKGDGKRAIQVEAQPKKRKEVIQIEEESESEKSQSEESESEESESEESGSEESEAENKVEKEDPPGTKKEQGAHTFSHHLSRKCVVGHHCCYEGPNLKRHLKNVHVRKNHISEEQVEKYFAMGLEGKKKRGPPIKTKAGKKTKGRWKRWCPQPGCHYLGPYLSEHLQNKHRMKSSSSSYKIALKIAVRYKGLNDKLEMMTGKKASPAPPRKDLMLMTKRMKSYHQHLRRSHENLAHRHLPKGSQPHQLQQLKQPQFLYHLRLKPSHRQQAKPIPTMSNQMRMMGLTPWLQISSKKHIQRQNATSGCASFTDAFSCLHQAFIRKGTGCNTPAR